MFQRKIIWKAIIGIFVVIVILTAFLVYKGPQILLAEKIQRGILAKQESVPVIQLKAEIFQGTIKRFNLGPLSFEVPLNRIKKVKSWNPKIPSILLENENLHCVIFLPNYREGEDHLIRSRLGFLPSDILNDEVAIWAMLYKAGPNDYSFWMNDIETARLETILGLKKFLSVGSVDKVEVFYNKEMNIKGYLTDRKLRYYEYDYEYYSYDQKTRGVVRFWVNIMDKENRDFVFAFIGSLSLQPGKVTMKDPPELIVEKTVAAIQEYIHQPKGLGK
jgi:hypothetical protein